MSFRILKKFNESGQKKVYLIEDDKYGVIVLKHGICKSISELERIKREIEILQSIDSLYFPKIYNFEVRPDGTFILFEEYIKSESLRNMIALYTNEKDAFSLILKIINAMETVWNKRIVHRDLKPENILIRLDDHEPVIIDFGIARITEEGKSLTKTHLINGPHTPGYASPEQIKNEKDLITFKSDIYCLGIVLTELILGVNPFNPTLVGRGLCCNDNILLNQYKLETQDKSISEQAQNIIKKMLAFHPYQRYRKISILKNDIEVFLYGKN